MSVVIKPQYEQHKQLCDGLNDLYIRKNMAYGDSFHDTFVDLGIISAVTQIAHKYNRLKTLALDMDKGELDDNGESIVDTLRDMANYCLLTVMEIENAQKGEKTC